MLELINIKKDYVAGDAKVPALKGVSLKFGKNEFVSILGPSGCGKTTLLNIIGGLDRYTEGKLLINGKSTEEFKAADWDAYRNRCIGFVFQSYNLIPHLTVLGNVELALTLSGVTPAERHEKAVKALERVGLTAEMKKRPNQLSGGQMQRVAIARAIVNDPEIILADEPTGALDSKTSVQIMDLLKEISGDKLIIMVTHNKALAEEYSNRIITMLDGEKVGDTAPQDESIASETASSLEENNSAEPEAKPEKAKLKRTAMSFFTALSISMKNLFTKKGRTFMTAFASSIGIIGIALVLAISNGFSEYISRLQSDTLASYPVTISQSIIDLESTMQNMSTSKRPEMMYPGENKLGVYNPDDNASYSIVSNIITKEYVDYVEGLRDKKLDGEDLFIDIQYSYQPEMQFAAPNRNIISDSSNSMMQMMGLTASATVQEAMENSQFVQSQYDIVYGSYPAESSDGVHQVALITDKYNRLSISMLKKLGIKFTFNGDSYEPIDYDDIIGTEFKLLSNDVYYQKIQSENDGLYFKPCSSTITEAQYNDERNFTLKIVGIMRVKDTAPLSLYNTGLLFLPSLTQAFLEDCKTSEIVEAQLENFQSNDLASLVSYKSGKYYDSLAGDKVSYNKIPLAFLMDMRNNGYYSSTLTVDQAKEYVLQQLGYSTVPSSIYIYAKNFDAKKAITEYLAEWNNTQAGKANPINYTDAAEILSSTMGQMVDIISYVLIAFACVSLIVSSIMIGIITYASVIERTKEIGVLRSIGARKKDIARVFNAETILIGFVAGLIGIIISYILCFPINAIILGLAGDMVTENLAVLNPLHALALVAISMVLTLIGGLIPAMIAAKKDPVVALRSE